MSFVAFFVGVFVGFLAANFVYEQSKLSDKVSSHLAEEYRQVPTDEMIVLKKGQAGSVIMPMTEHDVERQVIIERNNKLGVDTPLEQLR